MRELEQFGDSTLDRFVRSARSGGMVRADRYVYTRTQDTGTLLRVFFSSGVVVLIVAGIFAVMYEVPLFGLPNSEQFAGSLASHGFGILAGALFLWLELEVHTLKKEKLNQRPTRDG